MRDGKESSAAWLQIDGVFTSMQAYKPVSTSEVAFYDDSVGTSTRCSRRGATGSTRAAATTCRC